MAFGLYFRCRLIVGPTCVVLSDTWYYTTVDVAIDRSYIVSTALNAYVDDGGSLVNQRVGTISDGWWGAMSNAGVHIDIGDNYDAGAWMMVGEASFGTNDPIPEPVTLLLFGVGLVGLFERLVRAQGRLAPSPSPTLAS